MIRETFWNTYEHDDFIKPLKDIRVAGILLHHRCCSGRFFELYTKQMQSIEVPVLVYDCANSEHLIRAINIAIDGPDAYALHILQIFKDSLRLSFHDQNKIPTWIQTLSWQFHLQSTVYIKEADLLMRAGNDAEDVRLYEQARRNTLAHTFQTQFQGNTYTYFAVNSPRARLGYLIIQDKDTPGIYYQRAVDLLVDYLLPELAIAIMQNVSELDNKAADVNDLMTMLVRGRLTDNTVLRQKAAALGMPYEHNRVTVELETEGNDPMSCVRCGILFIQELEKNQSGCFSKVYPVDLALTVLELNDESILQCEYKNAIQDLAAVASSEGVFLRVAVSTIAQDLSQIPRTVTEAEAALRYGKMFDPQQAVAFYEHYFIYHLLTSTINNKVVSKLYNDIIRRVTIYDAEHKTALIETLRALTMCDFNMQQTADYLYIHRNTLYKRIEKLEELLGMDFHSTNDYFILQIAVRLQQLFS